MPEVAIVAEVPKTVVIELSQEEIDDGWSVAKKK